MNAISSLKNEEILGNTINVNLIEFGYTPSINNWVGYNSSGKLVRKSSLFTSNDPAIIGVVVSVQKRVTILTEGIWKTNFYNNYSKGQALFLSENGEATSHVENTTCFVKKLATKIPEGIIVKINIAERYQHI